RPPSGGGPAGRRRPPESATNRRSAPRPAADQRAAPAPRSRWRRPGRGSSSAPFPPWPDHPDRRRPTLFTDLAALDALEGPFGLAAKAPLAPHCPPSGAVLGALAAGLLPGRVEGPQPDRGRPQVPVQQPPLARSQPPQVLHRQQRPIAGRLVERM